MPESTIHPNHAANMTAKAARWAGALKERESSGVPAALIELAKAGPIGETLARHAWETLALALTGAGSTGHAESTPSESTRRAIEVLCRPDARDQAVARLRAHPIVMRGEAVEAVLGELDRA